MVAYGIDITYIPSWTALAFTLVALLAVAGGAYKRLRAWPDTRRDRKPISVNFHFSRVCNYSCGFCFHTAKDSHMTKLEDAKRGLRKLKEAGMRKLNMAGGEPFLYPAYLGALIRYAKQDLKLESVTIVSNGSRIERSFLEEYAEDIDILAISCDSFDDETNRAIGRAERGNAGQVQHVAKMEQIAEWCQEYGIKFKLNTVVNALNWSEDMTHRIARLNPYRWKVFQVLVLQSENAGSIGDQPALRDASRFEVSKEQFDAFVERHRALNPVAESNEAMQNSYLILDEYMRFLDCSSGGKQPTRSILDVSVAEALAESGWDEDMFYKRGGKYAWSKRQVASSTTTTSSAPACVKAP